MEENAESVVEPPAADTLDGNPLLAKEEENEYENETEDFDDEEEYGDGCCPLEGDVDSILKGSEDPLMMVQKARHAVTGRGVTLAMLMADGVIHPGQDAMSIDYLGQKFTADLLPDGKIKWREAGRVFSSPSAWAIHCKKIVNPMKKSGCGWASVRYKGRKLDVYKSAWFRKHRPVLMSVAGNYNETDDDYEDGDSEIKIKLESNEEGNDNAVDTLSNGGCLTGKVIVDYQPSVRHCTLGRRNMQHNPNTLVECSSFMTLAKIQPFNLSISSNCLLLLNFHCHLTCNEVIGYFAGKWDSTTQKLMVQSVFPCCCNVQNKDSAPTVEDNVRISMEQRGLVLAGWYHSHPKCQPDPSLKDIESQMEYQHQLKGSPNTFQPCFAIIVSPFICRFPGKTSELQAFYIMPPPEQRPLDYGMPMIVDYTLSHDSFITDDVYKEMVHLIEFYKNDPDYKYFKEKSWSSSAYLNNLENILARHCPNGLLDKRLSEILKTI